jgi:imidazolonepropionase
MSLCIQNARVIGADGRAAGSAAAVRVAAGKIVAVGTQVRPEPEDEVFDAEGRVVMPGFVDCHTHALWAGDRLDEFELKQRGASYLDILKRGGGILSTVRQVRATSEEQLTERLVDRLMLMLSEGTTSVEVKSGYGLTTEDELKMLRSIAGARARFPGTLYATALLGHALDPEQPNFVERVVCETLPAVHAEFPGIFVDAYCEQGAWSVADCRRLLESALELGHPVRLHTDQFHALGGLDLAIAVGARSADHLEATAPQRLEELARSSTYGVMLPASGFHVDDRYANARFFLDAGGKLALGTNCNPGSAPTHSMPFVIALSVRKLGLTTAEAIVATTSVPAALLGATDRGSLAPRMRADLILLRHRDERMLGFELGGNPIVRVLCGGEWL